jgi:hypothetical protein
MSKILTGLFVLLFPALAIVHAGSAPGDEASRVALEFINGYVKASPGFSDGYESAIAWVAKSPLANSSYKSALAKLYRDALKKDPEAGYGSDAVLGGQDFPEVLHVKKARATGDKAMVILSGDASFPMEVRVLLVKTDGRWLVDGSGDLIR